MNNDDDQHKVLLTSSANTDVFPFNTLSNFKNTFPNDFSLSRDQWKFAMQSITFDCRFSNLSTPLQAVKKHILVYGYKDGIPDTDYYYSITLPIRNYTVFTLATFLNKQFTKNNIPIRVKSLANEVLTLHCHFSILTLLIAKELCTMLKFDANLLRVVKEVEGVSYCNISPRKDQREKNGSWFLNFGTLILPNPQMPKLVKVICQEMESSLSSGAHHKELAVFNFNEKYIVNQSYYFEAERKEYFNLNNVALRGLTVQLVDENDYQLGLLTGQPTFIKVKFKKMDADGTIPLRLSSNDSNDLFPSNISSNFRTQLSPLIDFGSSKWGVALTTIHYPAEVDVSALINANDFWIEFEFTDSILNVGGDGKTFQKKVTRQLRISVPQYVINSISKLIKYLNKECSEQVGEGTFKLFYNKTTKRVERVSNVNLVVKMSVNLAYVLGQSSFTKEETQNTYIHQIFMKNVHVSFGDEATNLSNEPDLNKLIPHTMLLYCDFVKPTIIGSIYAQILKLIPIAKKEKNTSYISYEAKHLDFIPVNKRTLSTIHLSLKHVGGGDMHFIPKTTPIMISLLFKKIQ